MASPEIPVARVVRVLRHHSDDARIALCRMC